MLLMATALLLPVSSALADQLDDHISELKKEADIGNTEAQKKLNKLTTQLQELESKAKSGDAESQYKLASLYHAYRSREEEANQLTLQAANQGYVDAQRSM
ncbi:hypothetical protein [Commensalibacter communis]|uniref:hypothetical protein n=1 Tax=Commensalibacter communis TaxID=2972786 RepID=UPI00232ABEA0|nr:hypothetical protein [Commensalibacter communis]